ncbi:hypothetical protein B0H13DRAFT_2395032 [Mycena leptocephala]|nr:hypothetical protein B0H13DRAFT_2395032 [Mycena leptocephala]
MAPTHHPPSTHQLVHRAAPAGPDGGPIGMLLQRLELHPTCLVLMSDFGDTYKDIKEDPEKEEERNLEACTNGITHKKREVAIPANVLVPMQKNVGGRISFSGALCTSSSRAR